MNLIRTISLGEENPKITYFHDGTGYGHDHNGIRITYNGGSYDNRTMPNLFFLDWIIQIDNKGIDLALNRVELGANHHYLYWEDKIKTDEKGPLYRPLHSLIPTYILGRHLNHVREFAQKALANITASYPLNLSDDFGNVLQHA